MTRIVIVSDTHLTDRGKAFSENWRAVATWLETVAPDLVVHLGDISADGENDPADLRTAFRQIDGVAVPVRFLPGNHDIGDNPQRLQSNHHQADSAAISVARIDQYRRVFGPDRWFVDAGDWRLLGLNAQLFEFGDAEEQAQWDWLAGQASAARGPIGLMLHKPLWLPALALAEAPQRYIPDSACRRLLDIVSICDLRFVVSGHVHQALARMVAGVEHIWVPSTAFIIPDSVQAPIGEKRVGVGLLELTSEGHRFEFITPEGLVPHDMLDHADVYPAIAGLRARLGLTTS